ncbi:MAG: S41 family peptidase, partial [Bacteroidota bacterium]
EVHPGTFRYNDENSINQGLATLKEKFSSPLTIGEAYLAISALLGQIKCDHTFASYYNQNAAVKSVIHRQRDKLPFTFRWIDGKMIVKEDGTDNNKLGKATEVLTINEIPVAQIQKALLPYIPADGTATKTRIAYSQIRGYSFRYDAFDIFHPLLFPFKSEDISLTIKKYSATATSKLTVKATTRVERNKKIRSKYPDFPGVRDDLWKFEILEGNVGLLTIGSFVLNGWKSLELDYKKFLADAFAELKEKKVESLIIDLRENMGGNDEMAGELATYFNISSFVEDQYEGRSRYKVLPEAIKPHVKTWGPDPWYFELNPDKKDEQSGYYIYEKEFFQKYKNKTKKTVFKGDIYLLTSSINVSLAYYLSEKVKRYKIATLIGQTTGGNLRGINGGSILFLTLPNSKIEIDLPIIGS